MPNIIVGTAGHVDHGKTALVRALTGTDTDRLAEEKRRGISIVLGFAQLNLLGWSFGFVDVPGHERFVRTMLAGAGGIDMVLLVVAADESVMPEAFIEQFKFGTKPSANAADYPPPAEIGRVLDAVHQQSLAELAERTDEELDEPVEVPHPAFKTKLDAVDYAPSHECIHVGQIALLRRLMGRQPLR